MWGVGTKVTVIDNSECPLRIKTRRVILACPESKKAFDDIEVKDMIRIDSGAHSLLVYRSPDDMFFCTDGLCSHEQVHMEQGLVIDYNH